MATMTKEQLQKSIDDAVIAKFDDLQKQKSAVVPVGEKIGFKQALIELTKSAQLKSVNNTGFTLDRVKSKSDDVLKVKGMSLSDFASGGLFAEEETHSTILPYLRPKNIIKSLGLRVISTSASKYKYYKNTEPATAFSVGETTKIPTTDQKWQAEFSYPKKLAAIYSITNDAIRKPGMVSMGEVENGLNLGLENKLETILWSGSGSDFEAKGLLKQVKAANTKALSATTYKVVKKALFDMITRMKKANIDIMQGKFVVSFETYSELMNAVNSDNGYPMFPSIEKDSTLFGYPLVASNFIPETEVYFIDFDKVWFIDYLVKEFEFFANGTYVDSTGTLKSGVSQDESVYRMLTEYDIKLTYDDAVQKLTAVTGL